MNRSVCFCVLVFGLASTGLAQKATFNEQIVAFARANLGKRVGGGECAHLATEALRVSGARFLRPADNPASGDYVWGTPLGLIEGVEGKAFVKIKGPIRPGDLIQYRDVKLKNGGSYSHHTAIVAEVSERGIPTAVYEENIGPPGKEDRTVRRSAIDLRTLTRGWVRFYRAEPRKTKAGLFEFTVTNNTPTAQTLLIKSGMKRLFDFRLTKENTADSHGHATLTMTSGPPPALMVGDARVNIVDGANYEIGLKGGKTTLRRVP